ncbi:MAG: GspH/FimT family pseudopilin [Methylococcales bacterium]
MYLKRLNKTQATMIAQVINKRTVNGFTLIELLVTLSIAVILAAIAAPSFKNAIQNSKQSSQLNNMISHLMLARSEASTRNMAVSLCVSANGTCCTKTDNSNCATSAATTSSTWEKGWITFSDIDSDGIFDDDGDANLCEAGEDCVLRKKEELTGASQLISKNFKDINSVNTQALTFKANGMFINSSPGRFIYCDDRGTSEAKEITIKLTGNSKIISTGLANTCP